MKIRHSLLLVMLVMFVGCATAARTNHLKIGMTKPEALKVMGAPRSTSADGRGTEILRYDLYTNWHRALHHRSDEYFVKLVSGRVDSFGEMGELGKHNGE